MDRNPVNINDGKKPLFTNFTENMLIIYQNDRIEKFSATESTAGQKDAGRAAIVAVHVAVTRRRAGAAHFCHRHPIFIVNHILDTFLNWS